MTENKQQLRVAVQAALDGDWEAAHLIAQDYSDVNANWLHAVLHKIEGDVGNSHYWYARTLINGQNNGINGANARKYADFNDVREELNAILNNL